MVGAKANINLQGININENTWRLLDDLGAAHHLDPHFTAVRDATKLEGQQRNGNTGELLGERYQDATTPGPPSQRIERYKLQNALLKEVRPELIQLSKRLARIEESSGGTSLFFQDGTKAGLFDLVIGADGIKSVVRQHIYPDHKLTYTGKIAYRVLIPQEKVAHIEGIPHCAAFWHTPTTHVYTNFLPGGLFEIATRALEGEDFGSKVQYGQVASREQVVPHYKDYSPVIRQIIEAPDSWLSFALFGGPRVKRVVHNGSIALVGDASHRKEIVLVREG
jgi:salicylate hydroxylase